MTVLEQQLEESTRRISELTDQLNINDRIYIAHKDDRVDELLAIFVNNFPERHRFNVQFIRKSHGMYKYGTKCVNVFARGEALMVRVGGGFMNIQEFVEQHNDFEVVKLPRQDDAKRIRSKLLLDEVAKSMAKEKEKE